MEILFKNRYEKTEDWIKECNRYAFFKRPIFVVFHILSILVLCLGIGKILFLHSIDIMYFFIPVWWFFVVFILYFRANKMAYKRNQEIYGNNGAVISDVTEDSINQIHSNGSQYKIYYDTIKKACLTQNYILLQSKANILYTLKRDGFSIGNEKDFLIFLKNKGIEIK